MEEEHKMAENQIKEYPKHRTVHHVLAHSYSFYFILLLIAVILDFLYPIKLFENSMIMPLGFVFLGVATILIFWAQSTSRKLDRENLTKESFCKGPYCYTRTPTHWGLFVLVLSLGLILNAFFVVLFTIVAFIFTRFIFIKEQEKLLESKYGTPYLEYKKTVKF